MHVASESSTRCFAINRKYKNEDELSTNIQYLQANGCDGAVDGRSDVIPFFVANQNNCVSVLIE
jgi:hypothetical protein